MKAEEKDEISVKEEVVKVTVARKPAVKCSRRVSSGALKTETEGEGTVHDVLRRDRKREVLSSHSCCGECVEGISTE